MFEKEIQDIFIDFPPLDFIEFDYEAECKRLYKEIDEAVAAIFED